MSSETMHIGKRVAYSALVMLVSFAVLEATARVYFLARDISTADPTRWARQHDYSYYEEDGLYYLEPGYDKGGIRINSAGLRGVEASEDKLEGGYRILVIGDSTVFGIAGDDCPWPAQLQRMLSDRTGRSVEVLNGGVEGYTSAMALHRMQRKDLMRFAPDLVIISIGWNDFYGSEPGADRSPSWMGQAVSASAFLTAIRELYFGTIRAAVADRVGGFTHVTDDDIARFSPTRYVGNVRAMAELARAKGAEVALATHPTVLSENMTDEVARLARPYPYFTTSTRQMWLLYERYEQARRELAARERLVLIDAATAFDDLDKTRYFFDLLHVYCPGNVIIAEAIARAVGPMVTGAGRERP